MKVVDAIQSEKYGVLDVGGSNLEFLALANETDADYCVNDRHDSSRRLRHASPSS